MPDRPGAVFIGSEGEGSASFGNVGVSGYRDGTCGFFGDPPGADFVPFEIGIPQTFTVSLSSDAGGGGATGSLTGFQFMDYFGRPLSNVNFTLVSVDLPEPCSYLLLLGGLAALWGVRSVRWRGGIGYRGFNCSGRTA